MFPKLRAVAHDGVHPIRIKRAIEEPLRQIVENAGMEGSVVVAKVLEGKSDFGFNAKNEKTSTSKPFGKVGGFIFEE